MKVAFWEKVTMSELPNEEEKKLKDSLQQEDLNNSGIQEQVQASIEQYFDNLDGQPSNDLYELVIGEAEQPLLRVVLKHMRGNQTKAADMLGLNRGTLRKKLKNYGLA